MRAAKRPCNQPAKDRFGGIGLNGQVTRRVCVLRAALPAVALVFAAACSSPPAVPAPTTTVPPATTVAPVATAAPGATTVLAETPAPIAPATATPAAPVEPSIVASAIPALPSFGYPDGSSGEDDTDD